MKKLFLATALAAIIGGFTLPATGNNPATSDSLASFDGGIGVTPAVLTIVDDNNVFSLNDVFGVPPGGRPWVIKDLQAEVKTDGTISATGLGLVFAGGNAIGRAGPVTHVAATLFCDGQPHHSPAVPLEPNGDFEINGPLTPAPPAPCINPTLLIRNASTGVPGAWFAAGIPK